MTDLELSTMIEAHVRDLASANGHPLFGRLALKIKVKPQHQTSAMVHLPGNDKEYIEIADSLFFFYSPSTILRWPKPVSGELNMFAVRVLPEESGPTGQGKMDHGKLTGFEGLFRIDPDGTLTVTQQDGFPVTVVALGNPGPELGVNTTC